MNKNHAKPLLAGVLALSLAGALTGCGPKAGGPGETQKKGTAVETQTVSAGEIATKNQLSGKVVPRDEVSIFAPQEADVLSLNVSVGDTVSSGMVLFTLDSASVQRQITQVEGERGRTASLYDEQISQARETLSTTKTLTDEQLRQAEQSRDNTKKLHEPETVQGLLAGDPHATTPRSCTNWGRRPTSSWKRPRRPTSRPS